MARSTIATILEAMADQIRDAVDDVTDVDVQVEYLPVTSPTPPTIDMWPATPSTEPTTGGFHAEVDYGELVTVRARVSANDQAAQAELLLALMDVEDPLSVEMALRDDATLGGHAADIDVRDRTGMLPIFDQGGDVAMYACEWTVLVIRADT